MSEWRPIKTHPKGGDFLATDDDMSCIEWLSDDGIKDRFFNLNSGNYTKKWHFKYWMPTPNPPKEGEDE